MGNNWGCSGKWERVGWKLTAEHVSLDKILAAYMLPRTANVGIADVIAQYSRQLGFRTWPTRPLATIFCLRNAPRYVPPPLRDEKISGGLRRRQYLWDGEDIHGRDDLTSLSMRAMQVSAFQFARCSGSPMMALLLMLHAPKQLMKQKRLD